jgi:hypothetical protein
MSSWRDTIKAQLEGGLIFGLTAALYGEVDKGRVQQSNFRSPELSASINPRACGCGPMGFHRDRMRLFDRTACRTIRNINTREFQSPPTVVAAAGVELRGMVGKREYVSPKEIIEATACGVELCLGLFEPFLRNQHVSGAGEPRRLRTRRNPPMRCGIAPSQSPLG